MGVKAIKTEKDLEREILTGEDRIMLFYSSWCPFCTRFLPVFEKYAKDAPAGFALVCLDGMGALEEKFGIEVVPSVLCFRAGKLNNRLDGALGSGLTEEELADFIKVCALRSGEQKGQ